MGNVPPPNEDLAELAALLGEDNVRVLIRTFLREYPTLLTQLSSGDRKTQHRIVHSLKSNARVVGARELSATMAGLEARLAASDTPELKAEEVSAVTADFDAFARLLRTYAGES